MKRKISYTRGVAATHHCDVATQSASRKMSHHQPAATAAGSHRDDDKHSTPFGSSIDESSCSMMLVRQNACCDSAPSPATETPVHLVSSCSVSSSDLSSCPFVAEREVNAEGSSNQQQRGKNLQSSLSVDLNQSPLVGFFSSSPSNESYSLGSDYDTRTHTIGELYDTERSYVESLRTLVTKYFQPLKSSEYSGLVESSLVDEIFYQIPAILEHHECFLQELSKKLESPDSKQCVGGVFIDTLVKPPVIETYTSFINHWKHAKEAVKSACLARNAFSKFLETTAREHKGKLALDALLIMPVQRIPRYELLIKRLLKHTPRDHPDFSLLLDAQKEVHDLASKINCVEREAYSVEQQLATLREIEILIEGLAPGNLAAPERTFIRHDYIATSPSALGTRKERGLFLFSDLLVIASVKRRSAAIRKSSVYASSGLMSTLEANKFKLLMRIPLNDLDITKAKEDAVRRLAKEFDNLEDDMNTLNQIADLVISLHTAHPALDETLKDYQQTIQRQLSEKQAIFESQLATVDLAVTTGDGTETLSLVFGSPEKRASWEEAFTEAKLRLRVMSPDRRHPPEFLSPLAIRKTRAGLQFTCAAPTSTRNAQHYRDVWVCNSDGYVGQVCILSLYPEPNVASCNGVCNARITCIAAVPSASSVPKEEPKPHFPVCTKDLRLSGPHKHQGDSTAKASNCIPNKIELESESSSESSEDEESTAESIEFHRPRASSIPANASVIQNVNPCHEFHVSEPSGSSKCGPEEVTDPSSQATMWLGTEDGCIHIYHCTENIRLKKNRTRIQQGAAVLNIVYVENRVFASLANGDVTVFKREPGGPWNTNETQMISIGSIMSPITRMLPVNGTLWCSTQNIVKILNVSSLIVEEQFTVSSDSQKSVLGMVMSGLGVWIAMQGSSLVRLYHAISRECICDVTLAPAVNKMLASCDDIIRQHKAACLRVTSLLICRDILWVGTSAGVILTVPVPHITPTSCRLSSPPSATGLPHGHTGHVRFLTCVEATPDGQFSRSSRSVHPSQRSFTNQDKDPATATNSTGIRLPHGNRMLVISGGDGYEDFRHTGYTDGIGREDSTNHLLLWSV